MRPLARRTGGAGPPPLTRRGEVGRQAARSHCDPPRAAMPAVVPGGRVPAAIVARRPRRLPAERALLHPPLEQRPREALVARDDVPVRARRRPAPPRVSRRTRSAVCSPVVRPPCSEAGSPAAPRYNPLTHPDVRLKSNLGEFTQWAENDPRVAPGFRDRGCAALRGRRQDRERERERTAPGQRGRHGGAALGCAVSDWGDAAQADVLGHRGAAACFRAGTLHRV